MDFGLVLKQLLEGFDRMGIRYALRGGFAMGALGAPRATADLDFLVRREDLERLDLLLTGLGYARIHLSDDVSQYTGPAAVWGSLDFIHAFRPISLAMLERAVEKPVLENSRAVRVLQPEDVIGLKILAMANNAGRTHREMADIEALLDVYRCDLDWSRLQEFFHLFGMDKAYTDLKERFGDA